MKRLILLLALLAVTAALCACGQRVPKMGYTAPIGTVKPATQGLRTYAPQKTASQDTAGAATKLPEAATAAVSPNGTLAP